MAKKETETREQNQQSSSQPQRNEPQRSSRQQPIVRREDFDPFEFAFNPFRLMRRMTEQLDRGLGDFWSPAIEVSMTDGRCVVKAELPGLKPEEVKVEVNGDALVIEGERKFEHEEKDGGIHRTERRYGRFYRSIQLPEGAEIDQAKAKFDNGILEVTVPVRQEQSKHRQITVEGGTTASSGKPERAA